MRGKTRRCSSLFEAVTKQRQICAARRTGVRCRQPSMQRSPLFWPLCSANWLLCAQSFNPKLIQINRPKTKKPQKTPQKNRTHLPIGSPAERTKPNQSKTINRIYQLVNSKKRNEKRSTAARRDKDEVDREASDGGAAEGAGRGSEGWGARWLVFIGEVSWHGAAAATKP